MKKVLFVCTANTCRSPMAEAISDTLAEDEGPCFRAEGAATEALEGTAIAENAVAALEEAGMYPEAPRRTVVNAAMVEVAELCSPWIRDRPSRSTCSKGTRRWPSTPCQSTRQMWRGKVYPTPTGSPWPPTEAPCLSCTSMRNAR